MRIYILSIFWAFQAQAYNCPPELKTSEKAQKTLEWLTKFQDVKELHGCQLEIVPCENEGEQEGAPVGEIFLVDQQGREAYLQLDFPPEAEDKVHVRVISNKRTLNYKKTDRYYEEENGRTEIWQLEMRTLWEDQDTLNVLELGIYSTNNQLDQPNGNDSHWYTCSP